MLTLTEAQNIIVTALHSIGSETIAFNQCKGRILADDIIATRALPPFDNSAMDGYAVRQVDTAEASQASPKPLQVTETIAAGKVTDKILQAGQAFRIFTGAAIPQGADAVVIQENTERVDNTVYIHQEAKPQEHIRFKGEDVEPKSTLLTKGTRLGPGEMAMLAAQGHLTLSVFRKPKVAVLPTGDEIKPLDYPIEPGQIPNSNSHMLAAQVEACGAIALQQPIAPDDPKRLVECLTRAAAQADLILTCGGVSVGDFDFVKSTLEEKGQVNFWKVAIKPGKPLAFGTILDTPIIGLPGNPVSSFVTFELFARPGILKLAGETSHFTPQTRATLTHPVKLNKTREQFIRGTVYQNDGELVVTPANKQGSGQLSSLLNVNCLIHLPTGTGILEANSIVRALYLPSR